MIGVLIGKMLVVVIVVIVVIVVVIVTVVVIVVVVVIDIYHGGMIFVVWRWRGDVDRDNKGSMFVILDMLDR